VDHPVQTLVLEYSRSCAPHRVNTEPMLALNVEAKQSLTSVAVMSLTVRAI